MLRDALTNRLLWARMQMFRWTHWRPFVKAAQAPVDTQERLLLRILRHNRMTKFGQAHGFDEVRSFRDFVASLGADTKLRVATAVHR